MIWVEIERVIVASQVQSLQLAGERSDPALVSHNRKLRPSLKRSLFFIMQDLMTNLFSWDLDYFLQTVFLR